MSPPNWIWSVLPYLVATALLLTSSPSAMAQGDASSPTCAHFADVSESEQLAWTVGLYQGARAAEKIFKNGVDRVASTQLTGADSAEFVEAAKELANTRDPRNVPDATEMPVMLQMVFLARTPLYGTVGMSYGEMYHRVAAVCARATYADTLVTEAFVEVLDELGSNLDS